MIGLSGNNWMDRFARWESTTVKVLGAVEVLFAVILILPLAVSLYYGEDPFPFASIIPPLLLVGSLQFLLFSESKNFRAVNGLLMVALAWVLVFALGMYPYVMAGMSPLDALFESVSGLTTTGATIMADIESWPNGILVWRSLSQWIGGIAVIIIFMYILPMFGVGRSIFANELAGSGSSDYSVRMKNAAKSFIFVYSVLTAINYVLLILCGLSFMDASCLAFTTIS
ncbi:MAG: potassium transporter TrkG, partial [Candidatus Methanomethylophilaceae archaeon]